MERMPIAFFLTEEMRRDSTHIAFKSLFISGIYRKIYRLSVKFLTDNQKFAKIGPII